MKNPSDLVLNSLSPLIKAPVESVLNRDLFFDTPLERFKGETENILGVDVPKRLTPFVKPFRAVGEARRFLKKPDTGKIPKPAKPLKEKVLRSLTGINIQRINEKRQRTFALSRINK